MYERSHAHNEVRAHVTRRGSSRDCGHDVGHSNRHLTARIDCEQSRLDSDHPSCASHKHFQIAIVEISQPFVVDAKFTKNPENETS